MTGTKFWTLLAAIFGIVLYFLSSTARTKIDETARTMNSWGKALIKTGWEAMQILGGILLIGMLPGMLIYISLLYKAYHEWQQGSDLSAIIWFLCASAVAGILIAIIYGRERNEQPGDGPIRRFRKSAHDALVALVMLINLFDFAVVMIMLLSKFDGLNQQMIVPFVVIATIGILLITIAFCRRWRPGLLILFTVQVGFAAILTFIPSAQTIGNINAFRLTADLAEYNAANYQKLVVSTPNGNVVSIVPKGTIIITKFEGRFKALDGSHVYTCYPYEARKTGSFRIPVDRRHNIEPYTPPKPKPKPGKG